ncbi:ribbon-helix-helix domain-containing protein [Synechococcus sp. CS-1331]|uniref:ribbon-helix-helix domain-containing protein n=1 Tax=Synechococcus sp. CS-1331 TaxID=2847973 RepID=UPI0028800746|nr:hypothetical protein [Synechococcus sp. CS-1331]
MFSGYIWSFPMIVSADSMAFRKPVRISITVSHFTCAELMRVSDEQGRSLSNFASFLLETSLAKYNQ